MHSGLVHCAVALLCLCQVVPVYYWVSMVCHYFTNRWPRMSWGWVLPTQHSTFQTTISLDSSTEPWPALRGQLSSFHPDPVHFSFQFSLFLVKVLIFHSLWRLAMACWVLKRSSDQRWSTPFFIIWSKSIISNIYFIVCQTAITPGCSLV